ncbi:DUF1109 domain-containing protein [Aurantimonas sp. E1-2-R+4]|uniref:DUF1109 domain-containing protein n=1 Tax=Aurantimonas sp. E1-2-R+4 TaxID=3113714 RepID=UPI002F9599E2
MQTDALIDRLARDAGPVRPLPPAWRRCLGWLAMAVGFAAVIVLLMSPRPDLAEQLRETRFWVEQLAALATAILAAHAALALSVPGTSRRVALSPLLPAALWLGSQGVGCLSALTGRSGVSITGEPECLVFIALTGSLPAVALVAMLRRGFPVRPRLNLALAVLAAAALGNLGLRLFHPQDAALMVLIWQSGSVALLSFAGWLLGRTVLDRPVAT